MLTGWMNRRQQDVIECLREENRVLREKLGRKGIFLDDSHQSFLELLWHDEHD